MPQMVKTVDETKEGEREEMRRPGTEPVVRTQVAKLIQFMDQKLEGKIM